MCQHWRALFDSIHLSDLTDYEQARVVELDTCFGLMMQMHVYLTKVTISKEEIKEAKVLGRALATVYNQMNRTIGMKEWAVTYEIWWLLEEQFDEMRISSTHMIGPMILGGMQALERVHKDDKEFAKRSCSSKKLFKRLFTLKAILFASQKHFPHQVAVPKHQHAVKEYDEIEHADRCRRCKQTFDATHERLALPVVMTREEEALHLFKAPLCRRCCHSADYHANVIRPGRATGAWEQLQIKESELTGAEAEGMHDDELRAGNDDDDDEDDATAPVAHRLAELPDAADQQGGQELLQDEQRDAQRAALAAAADEAAADDADLDDADLEDAEDASMMNDDALGF